jgi:hypothetical protein
VIQTASPRQVEPLPALILYRKLAAGTTAAFIFKFAGVLVLTTAAFEITAVKTGLYTYYGHAPSSFMSIALAATGLWWTAQLLLRLPAAGSARTEPAASAARVPARSLASSPT